RGRARVEQREHDGRPAQLVQRERPAVRVVVVRQREVGRGHARLHEHGARREGVVDRHHQREGDRRGSGRDEQAAHAPRLYNPRRMPTLWPETEALRGELQRLRREVHAEPELAWAETRTAARVARFLEGSGLAVRTGRAGTGLTAETAGPARRWLP